MWLIFVLYFLMATTFTAAKTAVLYMQPIYFIAFRMLIAGILLLGYSYRKGVICWKQIKHHATLFGAIIIFHIYIAYIFEFIALKDMSSSKACLIYNISPFITAILCHLLYGQALSRQKWIGMGIGLSALIPLLWADNASVLRCCYQFGVSDIILLVAVTSSAYGWLVMKQLLVTHEYKATVVNGIGMVGGGALALLTAFVIEGVHPFVPTPLISDALGQMVMRSVGAAATPIVMVCICMFFLIICANMVGYNLYGFLLQRYSPTFLSFAGFMTPFFATFLGWLFLKETLTLSFLLSLALTIAGLFIFYTDEMKQ